MSAKIKVRDAIALDFTEENGTTSGYLSLVRIDEETTWLCKLYVREGFRKRGIATALVLKAMNLSKGKLLMLEPDPGDHQVMTVDDLAHWYERLGFVDASEYFEGDNLIMRYAV